MGISNIRAGVADKLARLKGELEAKRAELQQIQDGIQRVPTLHHEITEIERAISGGEVFLLHVCPDWQPAKAIRPNIHKGPFKIGELGKTALGIMRDAPAGMAARDIARAALLRIGENPEERPLVDKVANSLCSYLKKHEGDLVESDGSYPQKWSVIR